MFTHGMAVNLNGRYVVAALALTSIYVPVKFLNGIMPYLYRTQLALSLAVANC